MGGTRVDRDRREVERGYRRKQELYNTAGRVLRRQARRGDSAAALEAIKLEDAAEKSGIRVGGIRDRDTFQAGIDDRKRQLEQGAADREMKMALDRKLVAEELAPTTSGTSGAATPGPTTTGGIPSRSAGSEKNYLALDLMEAAPARDVFAYDVGLQNRAKELDIGPTPFSNLYAAGARENSKYRQVLDNTLKRATSPEEIAGLKNRAVKSGISERAFDKRAAWWEKNRK